MKYSEILTEALVTFYHGSPSPIQKFTLDFVSGGDAIHQEGPGIYLTSSAEDAKKYGKYIHEVRVKLTKSRMMPEKRQINPDFIRRLILKSPECSTALQNWDEHPQRALSMAVQSIMDSFGPTDYREAMEQVWFDYYKGYEELWLSTMRSNSWDGFVLDRNDGVKHLICFTPEILQIVGVTTL